MGIQNFILKFILFINNTVIPFILTIAFLVFVWNIFRYFIAGGANEEAQEKARTTAIWGISAFVVIISFWGVVNFIVRDLGLDNRYVTPDYVSMRNREAYEEASASNDAGNTTRPTTLPPPPCDAGADGTAGGTVDPEYAYIVEDAPCTPTPGFWGRVGGTISSAYTAVVNFFGSMGEPQPILVEGDPLFPPTYDTNRNRSTGATTGNAAGTETSETEPAAIVGTVNYIGGVIPDARYIGNSYSYFDTNIEYVMNVASAQAVHARGKETILDLRFSVFNNQKELVSNYEQVIDSWIQQYRNANIPIERVLVIDEIFWSGSGGTSPRALEGLDEQLADYKLLIQAVRTKLPDAEIAITVTPYLYIVDQSTLTYIEEVVKLVDIVGTDPYLMQIPDSNIPALRQWTTVFADRVRALNPQAEVWLIVQGFADLSWDMAQFKDYINFQFDMANKEYDAVIFFGWFPTTDVSSQAGLYLPEDVKELYRTYAGD
jgi:hypothetical protein